MVYIDGVQDFLHTGTDLGDALAQERGHRAGFTLAHQFLDQLPPEMRAAVLANARSRRWSTQAGPSRARSGSLAADPARRQTPAHRIPRRRVNDDRVR